jgi:iron complex transport system ATP-binding protein
MTVLEAREVTFRIGKATLLDGVSLSVTAGEVTALVGPNGAGKSTLLRALAGDITPTSGSVLLDGRAVGEYRAAELALRRAVMPQQTLLQFAFPARDVVAMGRSPYIRAGRGSRAEDERLVDTVMEQTDTVSLAHRAYPTLSGGEQQRVSFARVLAQATPVILLDEPTASLDIRHQEMVMAIARSAADTGAAVVVVLHDLNLAAGGADRIAVLAHGRLAAYDTPWQVLSQKLLSEVFAHPITVMPHPVRDCPMVVTLPAPAARTAEALEAVHN